MRPLALVLLASILLGAAPVEPGEAGRILLAGVDTEVAWTDGDTLRFEAGPRKGRIARLVGYNTLESYGPVHRWGDWTGQELQVVAAKATEIAADGVWSCKLGKGKDAYGRLLLDCPDARRELIKRGYAHVFAYDDPADPDDLAAQRDARIERVGMWEKGIPETVISSVRAEGDGIVFMRVVDSRTGETEPRQQRGDFAICDEICFGALVNGSCMLYVPYRLRYDNQPECLKSP